MSLQEVLLDCEYIIVFTMYCVLRQDEVYQYFLIVIDYWKQSRIIRYLMLERRLTIDTVILFISGVSN